MFAETVENLRFSAKTICVHLRGNCQHLIWYKV